MFEAKAEVCCLAKALKEAGRELEGEDANDKESIMDCGDSRRLCARISGTLSLLGDYSTRLVATGQVRYEVGVAVPDATIWQPMLISHYPFEKSILGVLFHPCVLLDRILWHVNRTFPTDG